MKKVTMRLGGVRQRQALTGRMEASGIVLPFYVDFSWGGKVRNIQAVSWHGTARSCHTSWSSWNWHLGCTDRWQLRLGCAFVSFVICWIMTQVPGWRIIKMYQRAEMGPK